MLAPQCSEDLHTPIASWHFAKNTKVEETLANAITRWGGTSGGMEIGGAFATLTQIRQGGINPHYCAMDGDCACFALVSSLLTDEIKQMDAAIDSTEGVTDVSTSMQEKLKAYKDAEASDKKKAAKAAKAVAARNFAAMASTAATATPASASTATTPAAAQGWCVHVV